MRPAAGGDAGVVPEAVDVAEIGIEGGQGLAELGRVAEAARADGGKGFGAEWGPAWFILGEGFIPDPENVDGGGVVAGDLLA